MGIQYLKNYKRDQRTKNQTENIEEIKKNSFKNIIRDLIKIKGKRKKSGL